MRGNVCRSSPAQGWLISWSAFPGKIINFIYIIFEVDHSPVTVFFAYYLKLTIFFQIKKVELKDGQVLFCIWISKDPEDEEGGHIQGNHTLGSSHNSLFVSSVGGIREVCF